MKIKPFLTRTVLVLISIVTASVLFSCSGKSNDTSKTAVRVIALKGPTGIGMVKLMDDDAQEQALNDYEFTIASAPDEVTAEVIKGDFDIAAVPSNLAAVLYAKTEGAIQIAAVNTLGVLYILETGDLIQKVSDLEGKTIYATGQGSTPEYILNYILESNNITAQVEYYSEHAELASLMAANAGDIVIGMLPEPNVTSVLNSNPNARIALNLTEEWANAAALNGESSALIQGCIIVNKDFADNNKEALDTFLNEYNSSVAYVNNNVAEAAELTVTYGIIPVASVAEAAIPNCNITYIDGEDMKMQLSGFYAVLAGANPASVGGAVPDAGIYYTK